MTVKLHYDPDTDAAYLRLSTERVAESEEVAPGVVFDYAEDGRVVGMEFLEARAHLPPDVLIATK
jgi:uncharacterized protein YuzE